MDATPQILERFTITGMAFALAALTGAAAVSVFLAKLSIVLLVGGAFAYVMALSLSGNPRLFCLLGLFLTAPLDLDISFIPIAHMGGAGAYTIDLVDFFIIPLIAFLLRDFSRGSRRDLRLSKFAFLWGGLILLGLVTVILGPFRHVPGHEVFRMIKMLALYLVIINEVVRVKQFKYVVLALVAGIAFQCTIGLIQYVFDVNLGAQILGEAQELTVEFTSRATYLEDDFTYRIGAFFGHPNLLSIYLAMMLPIAIATLFTRINPVLKLLMAGIVVAGLVTLVLTLSRSGWISFGVGFVTLLSLSFLHPSSRRRYLFQRVALILLTGVVVVALSGPVAKRLTQSDPGAVDFRFEWMAVSWEMIKDKPILGFGLNTFTFYMPPYTDYGSAGAVMDKYGPNLPVVHDIYLLVWSEQGIVGLLLFLSANAYLLLLAWRNAKCYGDSFLYMVNLGCFAAMLALATDGLASFFIRNDACGRVFIIVAGLIAAIYYWQRDNYNPRRIREAVKARALTMEHAPLPNANTA